MNDQDIIGSSNKNHQAQQSAMDEGWWSSIMEEDATAESSELYHDHNTEYSFDLEKVDWVFVEELYAKDAIIELMPSGYNRGGLLVDGENIQGFVPVSHLNKLAGIDDEDERYAILMSYLDQPIQLKVIECSQQQRRIVFSERAALAGEGQRNNVFSSLEPGHLVSGKVTNITDFGVFVDLGGVEGLIHISELSWGRVKNAADHVTIGDTVQVKVLQINEQSGRIALSLKRLQPNPWESVAQRYHLGEQTSAMITSVAHYGAFARLEEGIEGLIHVSSLSKFFMTQNPQDSITPGTAVTVKILHIDTDRHRLGLGLVAIE
jgi:small subunit ribosomal protein S1